MVPLVCISEISRFQLVSVAEQVRLWLDWSETPEDTFCHDEAQLNISDGHGGVSGHILLKYGSKVSRDPHFYLIKQYSFIPLNLSVS